MFKDVSSLSLTDHTIGSVIPVSYIYKKIVSMVKEQINCFVNRGLNILEVTEMLIGTTNYYFFVGGLRPQLVEMAKMGL